MIDTIVFDFGGVLLDLDYPLTFSELGALMQTELYGDDRDGDLYKLWIKYEKGLISDETVLWNIQREALKPLEPRDIVRAWNAMLVGWNPERFDMLRELRKQYKIYLLSNTNNMHLTWVRRDLAIRYNITNWDQAFFDKTYYSHLIHMRKPDAEIYDYVTQDADLDLASTLFIDDNLDNVEAAYNYGWHTAHHDPAEGDITKLINKYIREVALS